MLIFDFAYIALVAAIPTIIKSLIDYNFKKNGLDGAISIAVHYFAIIAMGMIFQYVTQLFNWKLTINVNKQIRTDVFGSFLKIDFRTFKKKEVSEYTSSLDNDCNIASEYIESTVLIFQSIIHTFTYIYYFIRLDYSIAAFIIASSILTLLIPKITGTKLSLKRVKYLYTVGKYIAKSTDLLSGFRMVNQETISSLSQEHADILNKRESDFYTYGKFKTFSNVLNGFVMYLLDFSMFLFMLYLLYKERVTAGIAVAALSYVTDFRFTLEAILTNITNLKSTRDITNNLIKDLNNTHLYLNKISKFESSIIIKDLEISYKDFKIQDINLEFKKGLKYAITGHSGSGKSNILNAIMGYCDISSGDIFIDGKNIKNNSITPIIFYIDQGNHIFKSSFSNNTTIYNSYNFNPLTNFFSLVGTKQASQLQNSDNCQLLSGGEKQIISLARAITTNKEIIILDEPFSAIDKKRKNKISKYILKMKDKTIISVTHDTSEECLSMFDVIIKMDNGKIVDIKNNKQT